MKFEEIEGTVKLNWYKTEDKDSEVLVGIEAMDLGKLYTVVYNEDKELSAVEVDRESVKLSVLNINTITDETDKYLNGVINDFITSSFKEAALNMLNLRFISCILKIEGPVVTIKQRYVGGEDIFDIGFTNTILRRPNNRIHILMSGNSPKVYELNDTDIDDLINLFKYRAGVIVDDE
jgi:hypothetical protein